MNCELLIYTAGAALFAFVVGLGMLTGWTTPLVAAAAYGLGMYSLVLAVLYGTSPAGTAFSALAAGMMVTAAFIDPSLPRSALWMVGGVAALFAAWSLYCWVGRDD